MKRGGYGKPWRPPADGWRVPRTVYFGGLYQHRRPALNGLNRYANITETGLQLNQAGRPMTRYTPPTGDNCEEHPDNGLPKGPWIGTGGNQFLLSDLPNKFTENGKIDLGGNARQRGGKWVQAVRQWHGHPDFKSTDFYNCDDTFCAITDGTYSPGEAGWSPTYRRYRNAKTGPQQLKKFRTRAVTLTYNYTGQDDTGADISFTGSESQTQSVDAYSGKITLPACVPYDNSVPQITAWLAGMRGYANWSIADMVAAFFGFITSSSEDNPDFLTYASDGTTGSAVINNPMYAGGFVDYTGQTRESWVCDVSGTFQRKVWGFGGLDPTGHLADQWDLTFSGNGFTLILQNKQSDDLEFGTGDHSEVFGGWITRTIQVSYSDEWNEDDVYADSNHLLGFWPLNDDALYPPRTDGIWQVAPLMSRDERESNNDLGAWLPCQVDDLRSPITDPDGNAPFTPDWSPTYNPMAWFDPGAYGFRFPPGRDASNSAASDFTQFALTGKIFGMPMPLAFTHGESALNGIYSGPAITAGQVFENFFDFRAVVWKCCDYIEPDTGSHQKDWYVYGHGEWLFDAISRTGAQLPRCATQWTNNFDAYNKPAYAYLIQADSQIYTSPPDTTAHRGDALWSQKCMEIGELWPAYDFFRPAGADRFAFEQALVFCATDLSGSGPGATLTLTDSYGDAQTLTDTGGVWGGKEVGGFYNISASGTTVTLGAKVLDLPSGPIQPGFGKLRFPTAPAILGRSLISGITDNGDGTYTIALANDEAYLLTGDAIDTFSTAITYDGNGNRVSEAMTTVASNKAVTRLDDKHFKITATLASLSGSLYIMSHGAPAWYWDDTGRKGDFVALSWLFDYRTNQEAARLAGTTDCGGNTPPTGAPTANNGFSDFVQSGESIPFRPCCTSVMAITPNGETWPNAVVFPFPETFDFDRYGARWQMEIEQAMTDLLWQPAARPCGLDPTVHWVMDDGSCQDDDDTNHYFAHPPMVEARVTVPVNGGNAQNETAPTPPTGIGYRSPVTHPDGLGAPGMISFDVSSGNPSAAWTIWGYRMAIEGTCPGGCRFDYIGIENLPCVSSYAPTLAAETYSETALGNTGEGMT